MKASYKDIYKNTFHDNVAGCVYYEFLYKDYKFVKKRDEMNITLTCSCPKKKKEKLNGKNHTFFGIIENKNDFVREVNNFIKKHSL